MSLLQAAEDRDEPSAFPGPAKGSTRCPPAAGGAAGEEGTGPVRLPRSVGPWQVGTQSAGRRTEEPYGDSSFPREGSRSPTPGPWDWEEKRGWPTRTDATQHCAGSTPWEPQAEEGTGHVTTCTSFEGENRGLWSSELPDSAAQVLCSLQKNMKEPTDVGSNT